MVYFSMNSLQYKKKKNQTTKYAVPSTMEDVEKYRRARIKLRG